MRAFAAVWLLDKPFSDLTPEFHYIPHGPKGKSTPLLNSSELFSPQTRQGQNYIVAKPLDSEHPPGWLMYKESMLHGALRSYKKTKAILMYAYFSPSSESASKICQLKSMLKVPVRAAFSIVKKKTVAKSQDVLWKCGIRMVQLPKVAVPLSIKQRVDEDLKPMPNIDYLILGYNVLYGDPIVINPIEGHDPGYRFIPIFQATYIEGLTTADKRWLVPDGYFVHEAKSCRIEFNSMESRSEQSYIDAMSVSLEIGGGYMGAEFKAGVSFQKRTEELRVATYSYVNTQAVCSVYMGGPDLIHSPPKLSAQFITGLKMCANDPSDINFRDLVENFGTHFSTMAVMGSKYGEESRISTDSYETMVAEGLDIGVSAGYSGMFSVHVGTETSQETEDRKKFESARTSKTMYTYGSSIPADGSAITWASTTTDSPMPINLDLVSVAELLSDTFKEDLAGIDYESLRPKLVAFLLKYCSLLEDESKVRDCIPPTGKDRLFGEWI